MDLAELLGAGVVVARHEIDYTRPLVYRSEPILVDIWVEDIRRRSWTFQYVIHDEAGTVYARALDRDGRLGHQAARTSRSLTEEERPGCSPSRRCWTRRDAPPRRRRARGPARLSRTGARPRRPCGGTRPGGRRRRRRLVRAAFRGARAPPGGAPARTRARCDGERPRLLEALESLGRSRWRYVCRGPSSGPPWAAQLPPRSGWETPGCGPGGGGRRPGRPSASRRSAAGWTPWTRRRVRPRRSNGSPRTSGAGVRGRPSAARGARRRGGWGSSAARATYAPPRPAPGAASAAPAAASCGPREPAAG